MRRDSAFAATTRSISLIEEIDRAMRPPVHERRTPSLRSILEPRSDPSIWEAGAELAIMHGPIGEQPLADAPRFADGLSSWLILVYRPDGEAPPSVQHRPPPPPPLQIRRPTSLAPLRHALRQVDGAAVFDGTGTPRQLGAQLVPSPESAEQIDGYGGMRHTSGRRYSFDDPDATVIVVSEDGPVTVLRGGELSARLRAPPSR